MENRELDNPGINEPASQHPSTHTHRSRKRTVSLSPDNLSPNTAQGISPTIEDILGIKVDMAEFAQPVKDGHGHSERRSVSFLPGHFLEMEKIIGSGRWPYRSYQDLVRHAVHRQLIWLNLLYPQPTVMGQVSMILDMLREEVWLTEFDRVFTEAKELINRHIADRNEDMAADLLRRLSQHLDDMPEGAWKERYRERFEVQFGNELRRDREDSTSQ